MTQQQQRVSTTRHRSSDLKTLSHKHSVPDCNSTPWTLNRAWFWLVAIIICQEVISSSDFRTSEGLNKLSGSDVSEFVIYSVHLQSYKVRSETETILQIS
jgi:hypothetical protein